MRAWIFNFCTKNALFLSALSMCMTTFCHALPKQVIIIRHAEKYTTGPLIGQLDSQGLRRAGALASFFTELDPSTTNPPLFANGLPTVIFAGRPANLGTNNTIRCIQTISPTATTLQLPIHSPYTLGQEDELASFIMNNPRYDGENVLICWHHPDIGRLVEAFGYHFPLDPYPADRFDLVWLMTFPAPVPPQTLTPILQELLYGDSSTPP